MTRSKSRPSGSKSPGPDRTGARTARAERILLTAHRGGVAVGTAREALSGLEGEIDGLREGLAADGRVMARTLRAAALSESGDTERALEVARRAAELAEEQAVPYGPPSTYKPPRELEGEILVDAGRPEEARTAFRRALRRTPRRARSLLGLARAAAASGHTAEAARAYAEVEAVWSRAEEGWPGLREAREYLAEHGRPDAGGEPVALPR